MTEKPPPIPKPGSEDAIKMGCTCPVMDNGRGRGYLGQEGVFVFSSGCPVHFRKLEGAIEPC